MHLPILIGAGGLTDVNPGLVVWTLITFTILLVLLRLTAWKPILSTIEKREKSIREALDSAEASQQQAEKMMAEHKQSLEAARKESADMVRVAHAEVEKAREELLQKARAEADALLESARRQIAEEQKQAFAEVRVAAVDLAIGAAAKLIQSQMSEPQQKKLVEEYLASLPASEPRA